MSNRVPIFHCYLIFTIIFSAWSKIVAVIIPFLLIMSICCPSIYDSAQSKQSVFCAADLIIHTSSSPTSSTGEEALKQLFVCTNCPHPQQEGSLVYALIAKHSIRDYEITGQVVYCIPNGAESSKIVNRSQFTDRIVLVDRGRETTIKDKISRITKGMMESGEVGGGASAIIIADDGQCRSDFSFCGNRMGSIQDGGFSAFDDPAFWATKVPVPVFLVTLASAERLKRMMNLREMKIPKIGVHNVTVFEDEDDL